MNKEVNFEIAKLLKEKGFDTIDCGGYYHVCDGYTKGYAYCYSDVNTQKENAILAPTIAEVVMWLYEKHGIWIHADYYNDGNSEVIWFYNYKTVDKESMDEGFNLPTEAYEAGITHVLENLI